MKRIVIIDYLKALFIILVIITHAAVVPINSLPELLVISQAVPGFIVLSGYLFAFSFSKKSIQEMYNKKLILRKIYRFLIPAVISYIIYLIGWHLRGSYTLTPKDIIYRFIMGLYGPGGYYCGIMLQFIFIAPILLNLVKKYDKLGVLIVVALNLGYEILVRITQMDEGLYRVLIFRYFLLFAGGMYLYLSRAKKSNNIVILIAWILGILYLGLPFFASYEYKLFTLWSSTSMISVLYIYPIVYFILKRFENFSIENWLGELLKKIGESSYHIMFTQLIYYVGIKDVLYGFVNLQEYGAVIEVIFGIVVSVVGGYIFYWFDQKIFGRLYGKKIVKN